MVGEYAIPKILNLVPGAHWGSRFIKSIPDFLDEEFGCCDNDQMDARETYVYRYLWLNFLKKSMENSHVQDILNVIQGDCDPRTLNQTHYDIIVCDIRDGLINAIFNIDTKDQDPCEFPDIGREVIEAVKKISVFS